MKIKAVLRSPDHPEYGEATVPFPIPEEDYEHTMKLLDGLGIGDVLAQDCRVMELDSPYPILKRLENSVVNVDELDYLAKRLDSFCESEGHQFQAMAHKLNLSSIQDFINLTFCCQRATVITDFSDLEQVGRSHCMNLNGGGMPAEEYAKIDGRAEALKLIHNEQGTITPYGVVYDNGMELEPFYDGRRFPPYCYKPPVMELETVPDGEAEGYFCLPMPDRQFRRMIERAGLDGQNAPLRIVMNELPEKVADALDLNGLTTGDLTGLNRLCRTVAPMNAADRRKLDAVIQTAQPSHIRKIQKLADNLELFDYVPDVHTPEEYGRYVIQQSGKFQYDEDLENFYDYRQYGEKCVREEDGQFNECGYVSYHGTLPLEELMREEPAEQYQRGQGMQML